MLPPLARPRILDIGCGSGVPTVELARLSRGTVIGMDIDQPALDEMERRAARLGLSERIEPLNRSISEMDFPDEAFDLVWAEGVIWLVGFTQGLRDWRRLIKSGGFLVVHEMCWLEPNPPSPIREYWERIYPGIATHKENADAIAGAGYKVLGDFPLPEGAWWDLYFGPLAGRLPELREKYRDDPEAISQLEAEEKQITLYRRYSRWYASAFYIMQKTSK